MDKELVQLGDIIENVTTNQKYIIVCLALPKWNRNKSYALEVLDDLILHTKINTDYFLLLFWLRKYGNVIVAKYKDTKSPIERAFTLPNIGVGLNIRVQKATEESKAFVIKNSIVNSKIREYLSFTAETNQFLKGFDLDAHKIFRRFFDRQIRHEECFTKIKKLQRYRLYVSPEAYYVYLGKDEYVKMCDHVLGVEYMPYSNQYDNLSDGRKEKIDKNTLLDTGIDCKFVVWLRNGV